MKNILIIIFVFLLLYFILQQLGCDLSWFVEDRGGNEPRDWFRGL